MITFPTNLASIEARIRAIQAVKYAASRNFGDGAVSYLSPYISRGVISTQQVFNHIKSLSLPWEKTEKFVQELAWRDYWQLVWIEKGDAIKSDIKHPQAPIAHYGVPKAIVEANTGIVAVDNAIKHLYQTGYMHNHMRMYVAAIACNIAQSHWLAPAQWMYSLLLDGDLASNHLSWQWVAGTFSNKKYYANQENINKYFKSEQQGSFLDLAYSEFENLAIPKVLQDYSLFHLETKLPKSDGTLEENKNTLIYNYYNLDPYWYQEEDFQRVLLLEPSFFEANPVEQSNLDFILALAAEIKEMKIFVGEFKDLQKQLGDASIYYKEHPTNMHYVGKEESRAWISEVKGYYPSFFSFWKKVKKQIQY